jgi:hypothetical protein
MTAYKLLVIISYLRRSCFAPTDIFALRQMHPKVGWASRPSFLDGRDAHPTITIKIVSYLSDPKPEKSQISNSISHSALLTLTIGFYLF